MESLREAKAKMTKPEIEMRYTDFGVTMRVPKSVIGEGYRLVKETIRLRRNKRVNVRLTDNDLLHIGHHIMSLGTETANNETLGHIRRHMRNHKKKMDRAIIDFKKYDQI